MIKDIALCLLLTIIVFFCSGICWALHILGFAIKLLVDAGAWMDIKTRALAKQLDEKIVSIASKYKEQP